MAKDPENHSEYEDQINAQDEEFEEEEEEEEDVDPVFPDHPTCPRCGWHNTRPSHNKTFVDTLLRTFALRPYRCRSCGNRFRVIRRAE